ncbi:thiopeptide-type bacteriocin biosynthesis protein [Actinocorallia sp. A-T 12471]|uniref:thiopeptide-type bacteriocin biosynthesis protein n=1 Tax=Actinocorallia sp. A-T 12471 TaxID=3089813 RepID=UPI0029D03625|nr:thiopeptide-type bacteriocin biosynthesis protein [Actinocorallia sp. A-T 12471]MDX6738367.1 thiopeptide-type bacteriocin biosynthesis protein [Actinocorallia sp. A-T 12471]
MPRPPDVVVTDEADRHLPLDLDHATDRELLRRHVRRGLRGLFEQFGGPDATAAILPGRDGPHVLEIAVPLLRDGPSKAPAPPAPKSRPVGDGLFLPGGSWLSLVIPTPRHRQNAVLSWLRDAVADHVRGLDLWYWLRYATPAHGPHLRVRLHGDPRLLNTEVLPSLSAWSGGLLARRLAGAMVIEPYDREIERYGGPDAIEDAERVFAADSRLVLAALDRTSDDRLVLAALTAAGIVGTVADGDRAALRGARTTRRTRARYERLRARTRCEHEDGESWADHHKALVAYRAALVAETTIACASSLVHMHVNRIASHDEEPLIRALAADLLARNR